MPKRETTSTKNGFNLITKSAECTFFQPSGQVPLRSNSENNLFLKELISFVSHKMFLERPDMKCTGRSTICPLNISILNCHGNQGNNQIWGLNKEGVYDGGALHWEHCFLSNIAIKQLLL